MSRSLIIGCGATAWRPGGEVVRLDYNADVKPDIVWDLEKLPLPFENNSFDAIYAFEVLEHTGKLGDWKFFFAQWQDFWRMLKPGGKFIGTVPSVRSPWLWGDPSHSRVIVAEQFIFLSQQQYKEQVGITQMSDFRFCYKGDFEVEFASDDNAKLTFVFVAKK